MLPPTHLKCEFFAKLLKFVASLWQLHYFYLRTKSNNAWGLEVLLTINCNCSTSSVVMSFTQYLHNRTGTFASYFIKISCVSKG